jgi:Polyketide cyclase / dehydrase and lipid transport
VDTEATHPQYSNSVTIARPVGDVYAMVTDITRMGEWSPVCTGCWWDEGDGPRVGASFTGRNVLPDRTWETHCEVVAAETDREFAWEVGPGIARWGFTLAAVDGGTELTQSWDFLPQGLAFFAQRFGDESAAQVADRTAAARSGIPATLAAIKQSAEAR